MNLVPAAKGFRRDQTFLTLLILTASSFLMARFLSVSRDLHITEQRFVSTWSMTRAWSMEARFLGVARDRSMYSRCLANSSIESGTSFEPGSLDPLLTYVRYSCRMASRQ